MTKSDSTQPLQERSVSVVIPVYNGADSIAELVERVGESLQGQVRDLELLLVNDGSPDNSHAVILDLCQSGWGELITYVELARNFGEHNAVLCGLRHCRGDYAVIIDDDFQNPPEEIIKLLGCLEQGNDVAYSRYASKKHSAFRNWGSRFNDLVATRLLKKPKGLYLSSFKAINRFAIDAIKDYVGPYPYIDGLLLRATRRIGVVECKHLPRRDGQSNYTIRKLVSLWLNMFTSFSVSPLRLGAYVGLAMSALGFLMAGLFVLSYLTGGIFSEEIPRGWASLIVTLTFFSGIQLLVLGLMGEYVGRIFMTQNNQPQAVVRQIYRKQ